MAAQAKAKPAKNNSSSNRKVFAAAYRGYRIQNADLERKDEDEVLNTDEGELQDPYKQSSMLHKFSSPITSLQQLNNLE